MGTCVHERVPAVWTFGKCAKRDPGFEPENFRESGIPRCVWGGVLFGSKREDGIQEQHSAWIRDMGFGIRDFRPSVAGARVPRGDLFDVTRFTKSP